MSLDALVEKSLSLDKWPIGRLISLFEDTRLEAAHQRQEILSLLQQSPRRREALFVGMTGPPGVGKSTLIGALAPRLLLGDPHRAVAVLAIDPSSPRSGGALLGDRTRVHFPAKEKRLFFRSQASALALGGVGRHTYQVCRLLRYLFDIVLLETVGIGQSETDVHHMADRTYLILQPMTGDQVQFLKAGIMEVPDAYIFNKSDLGTDARSGRAALQASFGLLHPTASAPPSIHETSAVEGRGLDALAAEILSLPAVSMVAGRREQQAQAQFGRWVRDEYGRMGTLCLDALGGAEAYLKDLGGYDAAQLGFRSRFHDWLTVDEASEGHIAG